MLRILRVLRTFTLAAELSVQPVAKQALFVGVTLFSVVYISMCSFPLLEHPTLATPHTEFPLHVRQSHTRGTCRLDTCTCQLLTPAPASS